MASRTAYSNRFDSNMKTKEQIAKYNKEYFARPEVKARAKIRNAQRRHKRAEYKKTKRGKEAEKRYRQKPKTIEKLKWNRIMWRYGITEEEYNILLKKQGGKCAICRGEINPPHIDHDHKTGGVRGILCNKCNMGIGLFNDDVVLLEDVINYLYGRRK